MADDLPYMWHDQRGDALVLEPHSEVSLRLGLDRAPLDIRDADTAQWLRACVWPSDAARLSRLEQGIDRFLARARQAAGPRLETCALPDAPAQLRTLPDTALVLCLQTIVRDYMTPEDRASYERGMRHFLRERPLGAVWTELEMGGDVSDLDTAAAITVRFVESMGELRELILARTHPHPRRVLVDDAACAALSAAFAAAMSSG